MDDLMHGAVTLFEIAGVLVLLGGSAVAVSRAVLALRGRTPGAYSRLRRDIGRSIVLGLELLIIADIILTVAVDLTLENAASLGLIVLVRTFLSFSLEIELEGVLPWRKRDREAAIHGDPVVDLD